MNKTFLLLVSLVFIHTARADGPIVIGDKASAGWDATTYEAAATDEQKEILKKGKVVSVTGEIVDVSCYLQLKKTGPKHVDCGRKCILNGQPIGLLDKDKKLFLVIPEEHHPRRDGAVSLRETFADLVGKEVTIVGMLSKLGQDEAIFVKAAPLTAKPKT